MTYHQLKMQLSKIGTIQSIKQGYVFTLLLTGQKLSSMDTYVQITKLVTEFTKNKYPIVECLHNSDSFFLMVLKPETL